ncbi:MAG: hypothetical protein Hals2KO_15020 [Halioglobus sp.]
MVRQYRSELLCFVFYKPLKIVRNCIVEYEGNGDNPMQYDGNDTICVLRVLEGDGFHMKFSAMRIRILVTDILVTIARQCP